jgi:uncharacterized protein (TIGR03032 family)
MRLTQPFFRLPLRFDAERLRTEIAQFADADWRPHPQGHPGNWALPLIALGGDIGHEGVAGPMAPTPHLERCPYLRQVMAALSTPLGRSRLMKLDARAEATPHVDTNYYWMERVRIHVPVVTFPEVSFQCGDAAVHMEPGECWIFDTWRRHNVLNPTPHERIHLVIDSVGSDAFWKLVHEQPTSRRQVTFSPDDKPPLMVERYNIPRIMGPWELDTYWRRLVEDGVKSAEFTDKIKALDASIQPLLQRWRALWARFGDSEAGWDAFAAVAAEMGTTARALADGVLLPNGLSLANYMERGFIPAICAAVDQTEHRRSSARVPELGQMVESAGAAGRRWTRPASGNRPARTSTPRQVAPIIDRPLIVVAAPRSGSSLLFETLAQSPDLVTVGGESHRQFESIAPLRPDTRRFDSNRLHRGDATADVCRAVIQRFVAALRDRDGALPPEGATGLRLLEKTPKNALRVPFLSAVFPDARFVYLYREPAQNLSSLIEGWQSGRFVTYPHLPDWQGLPWSYLLVPGWRALSGKPLAAIVAAQWQRTQEILLDDLEGLSPERLYALDYDAFLADPQRFARDIAAFAGVAWDRSLPDRLPLSAHTVSPPAPDKWRRHESELEPYLGMLAPLAARARALVERSGARAPTHSGRDVVRTAEEIHVTDTVADPDGEDAADQANARKDPAKALSSVHTSNLPPILRDLRASIWVTTFQAGNLILVREDGASLNTHFVGFRKPMGLAVQHDRFYVGTETGIREFRNVPAVSARMDPPHRHDAVFVFRNHHVTANIDIHEIAIANGECWYVNTLFSCLCTLDSDYSFVPRWRPRFISSLAPEDRCHLNGLAMVDGKPRYLTALGVTDTPQGWRANKKDGGVLLDYATREPIVHGLSMPHSPRWYRNRLWVLESGRGSLATVDLSTGKLDVVARVPGFTRGLDFMGPLAFIGLSQLRKSNPFTDIPITEDNSDRMSGVWVVNIDTGETVAFLKFNDAVQEIFAVGLLPGSQFPGVVDEDDDLIKSTYVLPDDALREIRFSEVPTDKAEAAD